jgi:hypothetical protein
MAMPRSSSPITSTRPVSLEKKNNFPPPLPRSKEWNRIGSMGPFADPAHT